MPPAIDRPPIKQPLVRRLPGFLSQARHSLGRIWRRLAWPPPPATILHITHYKAGSQWIRRILQELAEPWIVAPRADGSQFLSEPIAEHRIYPTLYLTREQVESVNPPANSRRFIIIRDLRDTLISAYFSLKVSHEPVTSHMTSYRAMLTSLDREEALIKMIRQVCTPIAAIQRSWLGGPDEVLKYEDLLSRDEEILSRVLLDQCDLPASTVRFRQVIARNRFEARTGGRKPGAEDPASHERKGVAGDWRNHFTDRVARAFKERHGELLVATGYERDDRW
jgi:lipopolysaccharide transport system ATP-binding protein